MRAEQEQGQIIEVPNERKYFAILPNFVEMACKLDPYERTLYWHYVRVGVTFESVRTTAGGTGMSVGKVVKTRKALETYGLISTQESPYDTIEVHVKDYWTLNNALFQYSLEDCLNSKLFFNDEYHSSILAHLVNVHDVEWCQQCRAWRCSPHEHPCSPHEQDRSHSEPNKTQVNKTQVNKKKKARKRAPRDKRLDHPAIIAFREEIKNHARVSERDTIIEKVGESVERVEVWREMLSDWSKRNWRPHNYEKMYARFDWFLTGERPAKVVEEESGDETTEKTLEQILKEQQQ